MIRAYNKAFVNVKFMLPVIGINFSDFNIWLQETDVPYTLIRGNKSIYVEKLAFEKSFDAMLKKIVTVNG